MSRSPPDRLLAPISKDQPTGVSLRYDPVYDRIQEARREDDASVPQGVWTTKLKRADWPGALTEIETALTKRSKDLQLAVWRVEALLQIEGLPGLTRGIRYLGALSQKFWPTLHPQIEEDDIEARLAPLYWLDEKLPARIGQLPIATVEWAEDKPRPSWFDLQSALRLEPLASAKPEDYRRAVEGGAATRALVEAAMRATPVAFYRKLHDDIRDGLGAIEELRGILNECCGDDAPEMRTFRDQLERLDLLATQHLTERGERLEAAAEGSPPPPAPEPEPELETEAERQDERPAAQEDTEDEDDRVFSTRPARSRPGIPDDLTITSRREAYRLLALAADYLAEVEPHSPTPHLIRRAIAWGRMEFSDLMKELVEEPDSRRAISKLLRLSEDE